VISVLPCRRGDVRLDGQVVLKKDIFCYLGSMKMLVIELKSPGQSGAKLLMSYVTLRCHRNKKANSIGQQSDLQCCIEQNVGLLKGDVSNN
jgi:hypothetical protein